MMRSLKIVDAVTLRHFGCIERLGLLEGLLATCERPCWTDAVWSEILAGISEPECRNVLEASFLGTPAVVAAEGLAEVFRIRAALDDGKQSATAHLGEAESIFLADKLNGVFVTDDFVAHGYAQRRLGNSRVQDTVDLLREAVVSAYITVGEAH